MHEGPRAARAPPRAADAPTSYPMSILRGAAPPEAVPARLTLPITLTLPLPLPLPVTLTLTLTL